MAKASSEKKYNTFVKGLITEANPLTFPENSSLDEDNFVLSTNGSRSRRLGVDYEASYSITPIELDQTLLQTTKQSIHRWDFPSGSSTVSIGVVRVYNQLWFINLLTQNPSANILNNVSPIIIAGLANSEIDITTINGYLIIVSSEIENPIVLNYHPTIDTVTQETIPIQIRDIWGVVDGLKVDDRPPSLTATHRYNLLNQGWSERITSTCSAGAVLTSTNQAPYVLNSFPETTFVSALSRFILPVIGAAECMRSTASVGFYPSNADLWTFGKVGNTASTNYEIFDPTILVKNSMFNTEAPKGYFLIDAFTRGTSRIANTGIPDLPTDTELGNLTTVATYAGRVFYSGVTSRVTAPDGLSPNYSGYIFFSQVVSTKAKLSYCCQEADPTSPDISDIIDTDGGTIHLPEVSKVVKLMSIKDSLLVFAENGIWEIYGGTEGGFKATNFQIAKISSTGISNPKTILVTGGNVIYWAKAGIFALTPNSSTGRYTSENLSINTIQTYYNNMSDLSKRYARGFLDERDNTARWLYNDTATYSENNYVTSYNRMLNFDLTLQAFYTTSIGVGVEAAPKILDFVDIPNHAISSAVTNIYVGNLPVLVGTLLVIAPETLNVKRLGKYRFLTLVGTSFTLSEFNSSRFLDWYTYDNIGTNYSSYLVTGHEIFGDVMRFKQVPYILFYLNRTETGFSNTTGTLEAVNPSSCLVQARWNWANSDAQGKWGTQFQAYRYNRNYIPSGVTDTFDTGDTVIVTKNKLRGSGRALSIKISSEQGKDLQLLGWGLTVTGDGTP